MARWACGTVAIALAISGVASEASAQGALPATGDDAMARISASPRHGEWVSIRSGADSLRAWVVYPERADAAPVVVVIHEIFGLSNWVRAVADQLAAEGFIAIAPDLLTMYDLPTGEGGETDATAARGVIGQLSVVDKNRFLSAVAEYGMNLPAAAPRYGIVGFCWGGGTVYEHAIAAPNLGAAVAYYGTVPEAAELAPVQAPVLGLFGGNDNRVTSTLPRAQEGLAGKGFESEVYEGAGHGFLRAQGGSPANLEASRQAWPRTIAWFRQHLEGTG